MTKFSPTVKGNNGTRLILITLLVFLSFLSYGQQCSSPVSNYCFNGNSKDNVGNNHSTSNNATLTTGRLGYSNTAYSFNGTNQKIQLPTSPFYGKNEYTYAAWVKVKQNPAVGTAQCIFHVGGAGPDQSILLANKYAPSKHTGFGGSSYDSLSLGSSSFSNSLPTVNQWYHVAVTRNNSVLKLYIDGKLSKSTALNNKSAKYATSPMLAEIGVRASSSGPIQYFNGVVDELVIYSCVLDSVKIKDLYNSSSCDSIRISCSTSPISSHCFNGNAKDGSGNGHNGTVVGAALTSNKTGRSKAAYSFDGVNDYISLKVDSFKNNDYTYSAWVKIKTLPGSGKYYCILKVGGTTGGDQAIMLGNNSGPGHIGFGAHSYKIGGTSTNAYKGSLPSANKWYHLAYTRTNIVGRIYVNGALMDTFKLNNKAANYGTSPIVLIGARTTVLQHFNGSIDDVRIYKCALTSAEVLTIYKSNDCDSCQSPTSQYCFNGNANDESGNGNNATSISASLDTNRFGKPNSAYSFNGTSSVIDIPSSSLIGHDQFTYSAWVYPTQNPGTNKAMIIVGVGGAGKDQLMGIYNTSHGGGIVGFSISTYNSSGVYSNRSIGSLPILNKWYHITFTRTNKVGKLYLNGILKDSVALSNISAGYTTPSVAKIGARYNNSQNFKGKIDDVNIFNCEMTASEVLALYNSKECSDTCKTYNVPISFVGFDTTYCSNGKNDTLSALPKGGSFYGSAMTDSVFNTTSLATGNYNVIYKFVDSNYCEWIDTVVATVVKPANSSAGTYSSKCFNSSVLSLSGTPSGGTFSGVGVFSNGFYSDSAGVGIHSIFYAANDSNGCSVTDTTSIKVDSVPNVGFSGLSSVCHKSGKLVLSGGSPYGGVYSGLGVKNGKFDPDSSGIGTHILTYTYTDTNSCKGSDTTKIIVSKNPSVSVSKIPDQCVSTFWISLISYGSHTGGTFYGPTVFSNRFYPTIIGKGTHTFYYKVDSLGCSDTTSFTVKVDTIIKSNLLSYASPCSTEPSFPVYGGSPVGGVYLVNGVASTVVSPQSLGAGTHTIKYIYTNACGADTSSKSFVINSQPTVSLSGFSAVCSNSGLLTLTGGSPSGGSYFGNNISVGKFNPATAGAGTHTINYTYSDGNSCRDTASNTIVVNGSPTVTLSALSGVCIDNGLVTLSGGSPTPGTYGGTGVTGTTFNPLTAGLGTHTITYKHTDGNSCSDSTTQTIKVNALPVISMATLSPVCVNQPSFSLTAGSPSGGTYTGTGVNSNSFNPTTAGVGTHNIVYTYTDGNSCTNKDSTNQVVNTQPTVSLSSFSAVCSNSGLLTLTGGSPSSGNYFGNNISVGKFNPSTAGAGTHTINYAYSDGNSCRDTASNTIVVNGSPTVTLSSLSGVCIDNGLVTLSGGSPTPGTYSGTGVTGTTFNPLTAGLGTHSITYKHTDGNSCSDSTTQTIKVNALPVVSMATLSPVCVNQPSFSLTAGSPTGGTYTGTGVSSNSFNPTTAGVGTHNIVYTYTDGNSCTNKDSTNQVVNTQPTVSLSGFSAVCSNSGLLTLTGGSPSGGSYFGNNISSGKFNPATAGAGTHTINYTYSDGNSCRDTASNTIVVNGSPTVTLSALSGVCIDNGLVTLSGGSPTPGTYSGTGVSGTTFNPITAGLGTHTITYKHTDGNSCSDSTTQTIKVNALPVVSMATLSPVCVNQPSFSLTAGSPSGGTYTGTGVSSNSFNPTTAGVGTHNIVYTYTDGNSCTNKDSTNQVVNTQPTVSLSSFSAVCSNSGLLTLTGGSPSGGSYFGNNISVGKFNPSTAGAGTHTINYTYSDGNSCRDTASNTIVVNGSPTVTLSALSGVCIDNGLVTLSGGSPTPGTYSGVGVTGTTFNPLTAGLGTHTITYKHTDGNSCSDSTTQTIKVNALPVVSMATLSPVCVNQPSFSLTAGSPSGGTYTGTGVSSNSFNPTTAGVGTHNIVYTYTDGNSCTNKDSTNQVVNTQPTVSLSGFSAVCSNSGLLTLTGGSPSSGNYFGNNISSGKFNPATAGAGTHTINYTYIDGNSCRDTASNTIVVDSVPKVSLTNFTNLCANSDSITFINGQPTGGIYKLNGNSVTGFNPTKNGKGSNTIWYRYTDGKSCTDSTSKILTVDSVTPLNYPSLSNVCNKAKAVKINSAKPNGGVYSGLGIVRDSLFDPSISGSGIFTIKYVFTNLLGCKDSINQIINVDTLPNVNFQLAVDSICANSDSLLLVGNPSGGSFSGVGVSGNYFNPVLSSVGNKVIRYLFTDSNGCSNSASDSVRVDSVPIVVFNIQDSICSNSSVLNLRSVSSPLGGNYSGNGVSLGFYNPSFSGNAIDTLKYVFKNLYGCSDSSIKYIRVDTVPIVSLNFSNSICSVDSIVLNHAIPKGGLYSGIGVNAGIFNPRGIAGRYPIKYEFTNLNMCSDSVFDTLIVNQSPTSTLIPIGTICTNTPDFVMSNGFPKGGIYLGNMVKNDSVYSPALVGDGQFVLRYAIRDSNGCVDTTSLLTFVDTVPTVLFTNNISMCSNTSLNPLREASPKGGKYYGNGVVQDTLFNSNLGYGKYSLKYIYKDWFGCTDSAFGFVQVDTITKVDSVSLGNYCAYGDTIIMNEGFPKGGVYLGANVIQDSIFVMDANSIGVNTLHYKIENQCGADSVAFNFEVFKLPNVNLGEVPVLCTNDDNFILSAASPKGGKYFVNGTASNLILTNEAKRFNVKYRYVDSNSCASEDSILMSVGQTPEVIISGKDSICSTDTLKLFSEKNFESFIWEGDSGSSKFLVIPPKLPLGVHTYKLKVTNSESCSNETTKNVFVRNCGVSFRFWPNPNNGKFKIIILSENEKEIRINIRTSLGQQLFTEKKILRAGSNYYDALFEISAGAYILEIDLGNEVFVEKFIVK